MHGCAAYNSRSSKPGRSVTRSPTPTDPRRLILVGQLYTDAGAFSDAVEPLQLAVKLDPNFV